MTAAGDPAEPDGPEGRDLRQSAPDAPEGTGTGVGPGAGAEAEPDAPASPGAGTGAGSGAEAEPEAAGPGTETAPEAPAGPEAGTVPGARDGAGLKGLSARDRAVLAVERGGWSGPGAKERAIRERLGLSPTRYYQLLNALLDDPRALAHDPVTVNRLRRRREERRRHR